MARGAPILATDAPRPNEDAGSGRPRPPARLCAMDAADAPPTRLSPAALVAAGCLFAIVGAMPLVVTGQEALAIKPIVFVVLAVLGGGALLVDAARGRPAPALGTPVDLALAAFLATALLSLRDTEHPELARYTLVRFAALGLAYLLTVKTIRTTAAARRLVAVALAAGVVVAGFGLVGYRQFVAAGAPEELRSQFLSTPLFAHSYLAAQSLVMLLVGGLVALIHGPRGRARGLLGAALVPIAGYLVVVGSRGAYLAVLVGLGVSTIVAVGSASDRRATIARAASRVGLGLGVVVALVGVGLATGVLSDEGRYVVERVLLMFDPDATRFNFSRLDVWRDTLQLAADHWLTGIGVGAYDQVLPSYHASPRTIPHAHDQFLHVLATQGLVGLVALLFVVRHAVRAARRGAWALRDDAERRPLVLALVGALSAILVYFLFETTLELPTAGSQVMVALALLTRCGCQGRTARPSRAWTGVGAGLLAVLVAAGAPLWWASWQAAEPTQRALAAAAEADTWERRGDPIRARELRTGALDALDRADERFPYRAELARARADLLFALGRWDDARAANEAAVARQPNAFVHLNAIGKLHMRRGEYGAAIEPLRRAISAHRGLGSEETYWSLGRAYLYTHRLEEAWIVFGDLIGIHAYHEVRPSMLLDAVETLLFLDRNPAFARLLLDWYLERVDEPSERVDELERHLAQLLDRERRPRER